MWLRLRLAAACYVDEASASGAEGWSDALACLGRLTYGSPFSARTRLL